MRAKKSLNINICASGSLCTLVVCAWIIMVVSWKSKINLSQISPVSYFNKERERKERGRGGKKRTKKKRSDLRGDLASLTSSPSLSDCSELWRAQWARKPPIRPRSVKIVAVPSLSDRRELSEPPICEDRSSSEPSHRSELRPAQRAPWAPDSPQICEDRNRSEPLRSRGALTSPSFVSPCWLFTTLSRE